jgi:hypothetical protein
VVAEHDEVQRAIDLRHAGRVSGLIVGLEGDRLALSEFVRVRLRGSSALHVGVERKVGVDVRVTPVDLAERVEVGAASKLIGTGGRSGIIPASRGDDEPDRA